MPLDYRRPGFRAVTPGTRVNGTGNFLKFLENVFGAKLLDGTANAEGNFAHAEVRIGTSLFELSEGQPKWPAQPCAHHVYLPDVEECYARAVKAGVTTLEGLVDKPYGERSAAVQDSAGNHWYLARRLEGPPVPEGYQTVTPYVITQGADAVMSFMTEALGANQRMRVPTEDGKVMHAEMQIDDSFIELADGGDNWKAMPCSLHVYVPDSDASYRRAIAAGAKSVYEPTDQFYGDRECGVVDPGGNYWFISTYREEVSKEEMERRMAAMKG